MTNLDDDSGDDTDEETKKLKKDIEELKDHLKGMEKANRGSQGFMALQQDVLKLHNRQLRITGSRSRTNAPSTSKGGRRVKLEKPPRFGGNKKDLPGWLASVRAYTRFYQDDFADPADIILFAESFLEGAPKRWFQPTLNNYLNKGYDERNPLTQTIFDNGGFTTFEDKITKIFGETDEIRAAEERIQYLR